MESDAADTDILTRTRWSRTELERLGDAVGGTGIDQEKEITVRAPAVDEPIGTIPRLDEHAVETAIENCREAAAEWRARPPAKRGAVLDRFATLVENHREELMDLVQLETAKARHHAFEEVVDLPLSASYYADRAPALLADESRQSAVPLITTAAVEYEPHEVVGIISPWNYPLTLSMSDAIPALAAGSGVVLKPDEKTPFIALRLAELLLKAGLPEDVLTIVTGDPPVVGSTLIENAEYLTFTGSTETGRTVARQAGEQLIDCSLELSGKNPMLVLEDAALSTAVRGAIAACFTNAGQLCLSTERIYVDQSQFDAFLGRFVEATKSLTLGTGFEYDTDMGSLIDQEQLDRVVSHISDARERGATIHIGGESRPDIGPYVYEPTILTGLPDDATAACEETFGPVVTVEPVDTAEKAIEKANDSQHGLNASVWTEDRKRGKRIASELEYGTVCVNDAYVAGWAAFDAPMGGYKDSGIGRRHGPEGLQRYLQSKTIATSRIGPVNNMPLVPTAVFVRAMDGLTRVLRRLR